MSNAYRMNDATDRQVPPLQAMRVCGLVDEKSGGGGPGRATTSNRRLVESPGMLLLVLGAGAVLRFTGLGQPQLWLDELIQLASYADTGPLERLLQMTEQVAVVPLGPFIQSAFVRVLGPSEVGARLHAALAGVVTLPVIYLLGRRLLETKEALLATLLMSLWPLHVFYSQEGRNYSLFCLLTALSFLSLFSALGRRRKLDWVVFGTTTTLLLYTNYLALLVPLTQAALLAGLVASNSRGLTTTIPTESLKRFAIWTGGALLLYAPWLLLSLDNARFTAEEQIWTNAFWMRIWKEFSGGSLPLSTIFTVLVMVGAVALWRQGRFRTLFLLSGWCLLPFAGVLLAISLRGYYLAIRQLLFIGPPFLMLAAAGIAALQGSLWKTVRYGGRGVVTVVVILSLATLAVSDRKEHADWRALIAYLEQTAASDRVSAPSIERVVAFRYSRLSRQSVSLSRLKFAVDQRFQSVGEQTATGSPSVTVHVIESRFVDPSDAVLISRIIEAFGPVRTQRFPGFEVHRFSLEESVLTDPPDRVR